MFGIKTNQVIGVDVGSAAVKIVQLHKDANGWEVAAAGIVRTAQHSEKGAAGASVRAIQNCLEVSGGASRLAVCGVGGPESAIRGFELAAVEPPLLEKAILAETEELNPFNTDDILFDYKLLSNSEGKIRGYVVAATNRLVKSKLSLIKKAGLKCALVDLEALSLINCRNEIEKPEAGFSTAIINIGNSCTTFVAEDKDAHPFVREIKFGGRNIIDMLAAANGTASNEVEEYLFGKNGTKQEYASILPIACRQLVIEINKTLRFYDAQENSSPVKELLVCGGIAAAKGLLDALNKQLSARAVLWNPIEKMRLRSLRSPNEALRNNIIRNSGPALVVAVGLAMRSI
ncbi:MAG: pilus assembly protein PilM [Sedimentisphaerales bacterium]|nr:pilus assembly protein PilM [Sedimentisphaerales bacterium]